MADEKLNQESADEAVEAIKEQAAGARDAVMDAAAALHGLNRTLQDEAYKGVKAVAAKAADVAADMAEIADPLTNGAASRINEATKKAADAAGEAMDKAFEAATGAYDKAFDAASKMAAPKQADDAAAEKPENGAR